MNLTAQFYVSLRILIVGAFLVLLTAPVGMQAAINEQISFQGTLKTSAGVAVTDGDYDIVFRLYDAASGGNTLWTGTHTTANGNAVAVTDGIFRVMLGSGSGNAIAGVNFNSADIYLGITIESDSEMNPRQRFGAAPYAFNADTLDGFHASDFLSTSTTDVSFTNATATNAVVTNFALSGTFTDSLDSVGTAGYVLQTTGGGVRWVATSSLGISGGANPFGADINVTELASEDFGDFTCNGTTCALDASYLTTVDISDNTNLTVTATGLELSGDAIALSAGYTIPLTASTTAWNNLLTTALSTTTGDWVGTFDGQEGSYYLNLSNQTGTLASTSIEDAFLRNTGDTATGDYVFDTDTLVIDSANGRVGIGTTTPLTGLSIAKNTVFYNNAVFNSAFTVSGGMRDSSFSLGSNGFILQSDGTNVNWVATSSLGLVTDASDLALQNGFVFRGNASNVAAATSSLFIADDGKIGIGTTSPTTLLSVVQDTNTLTAAQVSNYSAGGSASAAYSLTNASGTAYFLLGGANNGNRLTLLSDSNHGGISLNAPGSAADIRFVTNGTEQLRIDSTGNVGIGTTTPNELLVVDGNVRLDRLAIGSNAQIDTTTSHGVEVTENHVVTIEETFTDLTTSPHQNLIAIVGHIEPDAGFSNGDIAGITSWLEVDDSNSETIDEVEPLVGAAINRGTGDIRLMRSLRALLQTTGSAGTVTDGVGLDIQMLGLGLGADIANLYGIRFDGATANVTDNVYGAYFDDLSGLGATNAWAVYASGTTPSYFGGNIGIGTTSPTGALHVYTGPAGGAASSGADDLIVEGTGNTGLSVLTNGTNKARVLLGDNSTPSGGRILWEADTRIFSIGGGAATSELALTSGAGTEAVRIDSAGNVGIGTSTPTNELSVAGVVDISDRLEVNGYAPLVHSVQYRPSRIAPGTLDNGLYDAFPMLTQAPSGRMIMAYYSATAHPGNDSPGEVRIRTSDDGGYTWSASSTVAAEAGYDLRFGAMGMMPNGRVIVVFPRYQINIGVSDTYINTQYVYSDDEGDTWSSPATLTTGATNALFSHGQIIQIGDGMVLMGTYNGIDTFITRSSDNGTTWEDRITISNDANNTASNEPSFAYLGGGHILALVRDENTDSFFQYLSSNNGASWSSQGTTTFDTWSSVNKGPAWLTTYERSGELFVQAVYQDRQELKVRTIQARALDLINKGVSAWLPSTRSTIAGISTSRSGYPSFVQNQTSQYGFGAFYDENSGDADADADISFFVISTTTALAQNGSFINAVSIGTTTAATDAGTLAQLHIQGVTNNKLLEFTAVDGDRLLDFNTSGSNAELSIYPDGASTTADRSVLLSAASDSFFLGGNIGIGTTSPSEKLTIEDSTKAALRLNDAGGTVGADINAVTEFYANNALAGRVGFANTGSGLMQLYNADGPLYLESASADDILLRTNGSTRITINESGNIGIGTTSPNYKLHINGSAGTGEYIQFTNTDSGGAIFDGGLIGINDSEELFFFNGESTNTYFSNSGGVRMTIDPSGNVGIGTTSPTAQLSIVENTAGASALSVYKDGSYNSEGNNAIRLFDATGSDVVLQMGADPTNNVGYIQAMQPTTSFSNRALVLQANGGNVGIGTSTPVSELQVFGDIRVGTTGTNGCVERYDGGVLTGTCTSDERLKDNITPLTNSNEDVLENLVALTPVTYTWNETAHEAYAKGMEFSNTGLIAQNVEDSFPELVSENSDGYKQVDFAALPYYIIQAIKDMWEVVTGNQEKIEDLEDRIEQLEAELGVEPTPIPDEDEDDDDSNDGVSNNGGDNTNSTTSTATSTDKTATSTEESATTTDPVDETASSSDPVAEEEVAETEEEPTEEDSESADEEAEVGSETATEPEEEVTEEPEAEPETEEEPADGDTSDPTT